MYTLEIASPQFKEFTEKAKDLLTEILKDVTVKEKDVKIPVNSRLFAEGEKDPFIYLLKEGNVKCMQRGRLLYFYEEGDFIGLEKDYFDQTTEMLVDFCIHVDRYDLADINAILMKDLKKLELWNDYMALQISIHSLIITSIMKEEVSYTPDIKNFEPGQVIIEENSEGDEVYTMMTGEADVFVNGTKVGEIKEDETFGTIAALTKMKRTATIIARTDCTVIGSTKEGYKALLAARPNAVIKLVEDMSRVIVSCNEKIVDLSKQLPAD